MRFSNSRRCRFSQRYAAPFFKARGAPSFLSLRPKPRGWSAERRNHQPDAFRRRVPCEGTHASQRSITAFAGGCSRGSRHQPQAAFPGTWATSPCPSPASSSQSAHSGTRAESRGRPSARLRASPAGAAPRSVIQASLALQLRYRKASESMGNHDSEIVGAGSVD